MSWMTDAATTALADGAGPVGRDDLSSYRFARSGAHAPAHRFFAVADDGAGATGLSGGAMTTRLWQFEPKKYGDG